MSSSKKKQFQRREFLRRTALGGFGTAFGLEYLAGVPLVGTGVNQYLLNPLRHSMDSFPLISDALAGGGSMLRLHQAMAQSSPKEDWTVVTLKVVNHVAPRLVFALGEAQENGTVLVNDNARIDSKAGSTRQMLLDKGVLNLSDMNRYKAQRFNKWFADMLHYGTSDGNPPSANGSNHLGVNPSYFEPLSENTALQTAMHLDQAIKGNHAISNMKIRTNLPDLAKFVEDTGILYSPLGITCFNMGGKYDKAEGKIGRNVVCSEAPTETAFLDSRSVAEYVQNIEQSSASSYHIEGSSLTTQFDKLAKGKSSLRKELADSHQAFLDAIAKLKTASNLEKMTPQVLDPLMGNGQSLNPGNGAGREFLAQCMYVVDSVQSLEGMPLRNFSLFLNMNDLDGKALDTLITNGGPGIGCLTYIEGMRQLAMGLNMLSKAIAGGAKMIVQVISEGGRSRNMGDDKTSFAFVLGPKGPGLLEDYLYANMTGIDQKDGDLVLNPGAAGSASPWSVPGLVKEDGTPAAMDVIPNVGDLQLGVAEFLADRRKLSDKFNTITGKGNYVKLKRGA